MEKFDSFAEKQKKLGILIFFFFFWGGGGGVKENESRRETQKVFADVDNN